MYDGLTYFVYLGQSNVHSCYKLNSHQNIEYI